MKINYRNALFVSLYFVLLTGCAKLDTAVDHLYDKPQSITNQEKLDAYSPLKSYVDYSNQKNFNLAVELNFNDLIDNSLLYRMLKAHFDQISLNNQLYQGNYVTGPDSIALFDFQQALEMNDSTGLSVYAGSVVWHAHQNADYLNSLIADSILPGKSGTDVVVDFEQNNIGDSYVTNSSAATATVVADPDGKSGNALRVLKATGTAFPQFKINLPQGKTLGQYESVSVDFKGGGCCGFYGAGMRLAITEDYGDPALTGYGGPSSFGIAGDQWGRGLIVLPLDALNLTSAQKQLTSFVITLGSQTGAPDYLLDNVAMNWKTAGDTIRKSPSEKFDIIHGELQRWVKAVAQTGKGYVKSWSAVKEPLDDNHPTELRSGVGNTQLPANTFYWQDYLGKDYAAITIKLLKKYGDPNALMFITEDNLVSNPMKIQGLKDFIKYTEEKGAKVDGIATELALNISTDTAAVEDMLTQLAASGKLIKIASLDIGIDGTTGQGTATQLQQQADMYKWFIEAYYKAIPPNQRAGITFRSPLDQSTSALWRPGEPVGLWTGQHVRKLAFEGVVQALQSVAGK